MDVALKDGENVDKNVVLCILRNTQTKINAIRNISMLSVSISPSGQTHYYHIHLKIYFKLVTLSVSLFLIRSDGKNYAIDIYPVSA